jgi:copper transport protein
LAAVVTALLTSVVLIGALAAPAQAHGDLEGSDPADGATLERLPAQAVLTFSDDEVSPADVVVTARGRELPIRAVPGRAGSVSVDLTSVRPAENVVLTWQLRGSDGHVSEGTLRFHVGVGQKEQKEKQKEKQEEDVEAAPPGADPPAEPGLLRPTEVAVRIIGYLAMAVLIGGLIFVALLWPVGAAERRTRIVIAGSVVAGAAAAVAEVAITLWRADGSLTLSGALAEDFGRVDAAKALLWLLAAVIVVGMIQGGPLAVRSLAWRLGALVVGAGLIRVTGMNAHASQGLEPSWGEVADFLHLVGVSAWVGGLVVLTVGVLPRRRLDELEEIVPRFSKIAMVSVLLIVASGLILIWRLIWPIDGIWSTHYNRVLVIKLSIFLAVMVAASASKRWVDRITSGQAAAHSRTAVRSITTSVVAETALVATVLGAASVLATSSPGV